MAHREDCEPNGSRDVHVQVVDDEHHDVGDPDRAIHRLDFPIIPEDRPTIGAKDLAKRFFEIDYG